MGKKYRYRVRDKVLLEKGKDPKATGQGKKGVAPRKICNLESEIEDLMRNGKITRKQAVKKLREAGF